MRKQTEGFSLIELLIVVAIVGILAAIAIPKLMEAVERSRQRRSMSDMRTIATANGTYFVDQKTYVANLADLVGGDYLRTAITRDGWGNRFQYETTGVSYTLTSQGSDGADGPPPPAVWINEPFEPDLIITDGTFAQGPGG